MKIPDELFYGILTYDSDTDMYCIYDRIYFHKEFVCNLQEKYIHKFFDIIKQNLREIEIQFFEFLNIESYFIRMGLPDKMEMRIGMANPSNIVGGVYESYIEKLLYENLFFKKRD